MKIFLLALSLSLSVQAAPEASRFVSVNTSILSSLRGIFQRPGKIKHADAEKTVMELSARETETLSGAIHQNLNRCGGFISHDTLAEALTPRRFSFFNRRAPIDYSISKTSVLRSMVTQVSEVNIRRTIIDLSSFETRFYKSDDGARTSELVFNKWKDLSRGRSDIRVDYFVHQNFNQPSVIVTVRGSETPNEIVILGGHLDSISSTGEAPGADDNASGIGAVSEVLRLIVNHSHRPKKTIQFIAYAAEEVGLLGSNEIAKSYKKARRNVVGVLQLDMTLFKGTSNKDIVLISDYTNRAQNEFLGKLIDEYVKVPWGYSRCGYGCSDHAAWDAQGYPASFSFESAFDDHNPHIHTPQDTLENAGGDARHSVKFAKLALAFVVELAK